MESNVLHTREMPEHPTGVHISERVMKASEELKWESCCFCSWQCCYHGFGLTASIQRIFHILTTLSS